MKTLTFSLALFCLIFSFVSIRGYPAEQSLLTTNGLNHFLEEVTEKRLLKNESPRGSDASARNKRTSEFHILESECIYMTTSEGDFYHKAISPEGNACGAYISAEPDQIIEIRFNYLDVPCENGGLVAVVDGWELNGEIFPTVENPKITETCGQRKIKKPFISSQNVALIQYRMPLSGTSFSFSVRFLKNPTPCNVFVQDVSSIYTLRNYGKRSNCSLSAIYPAYVRIEDLNVGVTPSIGRGIEIETGTIHKCQKRGLDDYVQIGGSDGLDNTKLQLADSMCGLHSKPGHHGDLIGCGVTTIRLVSSGAFDNSVTVFIRRATDNEITTGFMSVICMDDNKKK